MTRMRIIAMGVVLVMVAGGMSWGTFHSGNSPLITPTPTVFNKTERPASTPLGSLAVTAWADPIGWANMPPCSGQSYWVEYNLTANASGGTPPYSFSWTFGDGSPNGSGSTVVHQFYSGYYNVTVIVRDAQGATHKTYVTVNVDQTESTNVAGWWFPPNYVCFGHTPFYTAYWYLIIFVVLVTTLFLTMFFRARKRRKENIVPHPK